jgi:hypothetical protein
MNLTKRTLILLILALMAFPAALTAQGNRPGRETDITGTIYRDVNNNGRFDGQDKIGKKTKVWLYRVLPDGRRKRVGRVTTGKDGRYTFGAMPSGKYFVAAKLSRKIAVRTSPFLLNGASRLSVNNIPIVTRATINRYPFLQPIGNPANLDSEPGATPFAPGT